MDKDVEARFAAMEARLQELEDQVALYQAVSSYGPAVDSLQHDNAVQLWTEDGTYRGDSVIMNGREEILAMLDGAHHRGLVAGGCAHVMSLPLLRIDGDRAIGLGYHRLFSNGEDGFGINRLVVSRWDWVRRADGWKAVRRIHRLLDGSDAPRQLLRETLSEIQATPVPRSAPADN